MAKFYISNEIMTEVVKVCRTVSGKESKIVLTMGLGEVNDNVICETTLSTEAEQIEYRFLAKKPEDFEGAGSVEPIAINASKFLAIVDSVLTFKEDIYLSPEGTMLVIGVSNKAKSSIEMEAQLPQKIQTTTSIYRMMLEGKNLLSVLSKGCSFADDNKGVLHNAIIQLMPDKNVIRGYSTDSSVIARAEAKAEFLKTGKDDKAKAAVEQMNKALDEVCSKNGLDKNAYPLIIPKEAIMHLQSLVGSAVKVSINIDENHLAIMIGQALKYTITQANETKVPIALIESMVQNDPDAVYGLDAAKLSDSLGFINKNNAICENRDITTAIEVDNEDILISSGVASQFESRIKAASISGVGEISVDGERFKTAVDALNRGNLCVLAYPQYVVLKNGTATAIDDNNFIIVMQVRTQKVEESSEEENTTETSEG